jgi:tape measure domain-containing protein
MADDLLYSIGIENESEYFAEINKLVSGTTSAFSKIKMPDFLGNFGVEIAKIQTSLGGIQIGNLGNISPTIDLSTFNAATANIGDLERAYEQLRSEFSEGGDATMIKDVQERLKALDAQIKAAGSSTTKKPFDLATASVSELQKELSKLQREFRSGQNPTSIIQIRDRLRDLRTEMGAIDGRSFTEKLRAAFSESLSDATNWQQRVLEIAGGNIIANLFEKVGEGIINIGKFAINSAGQFESLRASLNVIAGSDGLGGKLFDQFQVLASKSPFNFDDVGEQGTKLLAMGIPISDVTDRLSRIGDVAAGVGREKLPSIVYAYGQIKSQGKAMAGDLSQFINAGVPIIETLAEVLKKPQSEIKKLASAGKIGFADIDKALLSMTNNGGKFFEMMKTQSNTFEGLWSSMEDAFQLLGVQLGNQLLPTAKSIVIAITNIAASVTDMLKGGNIIGDFAKRFGIVGEAIYKVGSAIFDIGKAVVGGVFQTLGTILGVLADNALATTLIITGLGIALKADAIATGLSTAAKVYNNAVTVIQNGLLAVNTFLIAPARAAWIALAGATDIATAAKIAFNFVASPAGMIALTGAVLVAAGAYLIFSKQSEEARKKSEFLAETSQGLIDKYKDERIKIDGLFGILKTDKSREQQGAAIKQVEKDFDGLLPKYDLEKLGLKETKEEAQKKRELQNLAAKEIIESYRAILPAYITEQTLLAQTAEGEKAREEAQKIIRKSRLDFIAKEYQEELKLSIFKKAIDLEIKRSLEEQKSHSLAMGIMSNYGVAAYALKSIWDEIVGTPLKEVQKQQKDLEITSKLVTGSFEDVKANVEKIMSDMDLGGLFDTKTLTDGANAAGETIKGFAKGSLKDLQERLTKTKEIIDSVNPSSEAFVIAAKKAVQLENKIKEINDNLKLLGLNADSLAGLQARLSIVQETINKAAPNSQTFTDAIKKSVELDVAIKKIQDRIKELSLVSGSLEFMNFKLSQLQNELNKQPSGSSLIPSLRSEIEKATVSIRDMKIELGMEAPRNSIAGLNSTLSELNKKFSELSISSTVSDFSKLASEISNTKDRIKEIEYKQAIANINEFGDVARVNTGMVQSQIKLLEKEIAKLEAMPIQTIEIKLKILADKKALEDLKSGGYTANLVPQIPQVSSFVSGNEMLPSQILQSGLPSVSAEQIAQFDLINSGLAAQDIAFMKTSDSVQMWAESLGVGSLAAANFGDEVAATFEQMALDIQKAVAEGFGNALFTLGEGIGAAIVGVGTFEDAMANALFSLGDAILVQLPKVLGMGLIQSAFTPVALAAFPANLALVAAGLALMGVSGIASGVLGGMKQKREDSKKNTAVPNANQLTNNAATNGSNAAGLSAQSGEKSLMTNYVSITMPVYGLDGILLTEIQRQQIIQQEIK